MKHHIAILTTMLIALLPLTVFSQRVSSPHVYIGHASNAFSYQFLSAWPGNIHSIDRESLSESLSIAKLQKLLSTEPDAEMKILVEYIPSPPSNSYLRQAIEALSTHAGKSTYILFVQEASDANWLRDVIVPENTRLIFSVLSMLGTEIQYFYEQAELEYNPAQTTIDYIEAVEMAVEQLRQSNERASINSGTKEYFLTDWKSETAFVGVFDGVVRTNADHTNRQTIVNHFFPEIDEAQRKWPADVAVMPVASFEEMTDVDAISYALVKADCAGPVPWGGLEELGVAFQALGRRR